MEYSSIRIHQSTHKVLRELANTSGMTMAAIVDQAIRDYQRSRFWEDYHAAYAALKADPDAWAAFQDEVAVWEAAIVDGIQNI